MHFPFFLRLPELLFYLATIEKKGQTIESLNFKHLQLKNVLQDTQSMRSV